MKQMEERKKGEWFDTIMKNYEYINEPFDEAILLTRTKIQHKQWVKHAVSKAAFKELMEAKEDHSKVRHVRYETLETQSYIIDPSFSTKLKHLLFKLRTSTEDFKCNFKSMYAHDVEKMTCPLKCQEPQEQDTQEHILNCTKLQTVWSHDDMQQKIEYSHIFGSLEQQRHVTVLICKLLEKRSILVESSN